MNPGYIRVSDYAKAGYRRRLGGTYQHHDIRKWVDNRVYQWPHTPHVTIPNKGTANFVMLGSAAPIWSSTVNVTDGAEEGVCNIGV